MIAQNTQCSVDDREFIAVFQRILPGVIQVYGRRLAPAIAVEKARAVAQGNDRMCEWDGEWPKVESGQIVRTREYEDYQRRLEELYT